MGNSTPVRNSQWAGTSGAAQSGNVHLQAVLETLPIGVAVLDRAQRLLYSNPKALELRGVPYEPAWAEALHQDDRKRVFESRSRAFARVESWTDTYRFVHSNGSIVWVSARAVPLRLMSEVVGFVLTLEDVTTLKETEIRLHRANQELQKHAGQLEREVQHRTAKAKEALYELERLGYSIVHDMRAPLRTLRGYSQLLAREYSSRLDGQAVEYLRLIADAARRQDQLIHDVLAYHNYVCEEFALNPVELDELVEHIVTTYAQYHPPQAIVHVRHPLGWAMAHETLLTQCISALLSNAVKFVEKGATPQISIWTEHTASLVKVWVQDNGIGISPEYHGRIFNLFERLHSGSQYLGTGIGLPLAKKAMEKMQGKIGVESEPGTGARFWLELKPATRPSA